MRSTVEPLEGNKVKLSVEVDAAEFEAQIDAAFRRIAREARIPGFRPGKVPRRILEARVGTQAARSEALQHALPEYYAEAVTTHEVDVIAAPELEITGGEEDGDVAFEAVVEVRPEVQVGGYDNLRITVDKPEATDEEVDARIERLRENFAELIEVERPAAAADHVTIDVNGTQNDEPVAGLTATDYLYEVGSGTIVAEFDDNLRGAKVGDIVEFTAAHPDPDEDPVSFKVLVKNIKEKVLPELTDEWAAEASEFDTLAELRADTAERITKVKKIQAAMAVQQKTAEALAELVDEDIPDALVNDEMQNRIQDLAMRLQAQGIGLEQYFEATGQDQQAFVDELRGTATESVKVDLALRAVAQAEAIEISDEDLEKEWANVAAQVGQKPDQVRKQFERNGQVALVRSDLRKRKALDWLVEHVEVVDEAGNPVDRASLTVADDEDDASPQTPDTAAESDGTEDTE